MKKLKQTAMIAEFKRSASTLLENHIPGKLHLARKDINQFLHWERHRLSRWYSGLITGVLSAEEFGKLFNTIKNSFPLKNLKIAGISAEQLLEIAILLRKLFRAMMISSARDWNTPTDSTTNS